ncbi:MAG: hypothetical protein ACF8PN_16930 [Phycisphaerales bacterium]
MRKRISIFVVVLGSVLLSSSVASACPNCAESTEDQSKVTAEEGAGDLALGYSVSVLFMMSMPFMLVGGFGYALYRNYQKTVAPTINGD